MKKKACIQTYGCQMNVYDSERMTDILTKMNYEIAEDYKNAELVILNTCHIREKAAEKIYSELGRIKIEKNRMSKEDGKEMTVIMAGCVAQAEGENVFLRAKHVDIVVGPESYHDLPALIEKAKNGEKRLINIDFAPDEKFDKLPEERIMKQKSSAFITIQEGCDKFCSFCVVPYTRGAEFSRKVSDVIDEIKKNVDHGAKEITLLGQNVNAFHGEDHMGLKWRLSDLIAKIADINGVERIRYTTSHPNDMTDDLISIHGYEKKLMPLLNLPVQSGSDAILQAMNRRHKRDQYIEIMDNLKKVRPDIIFSSDFIVGFPGETDQDFEDTLDLIRKVKFQAQSFSFKYSMRDGTPAAENPDQVPEAVKSTRLKTLQDLLEGQQHAFNDTMQSRIIPVLFEEKPTRNENQIAGRSEYLQIVLCDLPSNINRADIIGTIRNVRITRVNPNSMFGELLI
jgi:tRNA-2-methylthio-N6-dimethylallyladenosine synthase